MSEGCLGEESEVWGMGAADAARWNMSRGRTKVARRPSPTEKMLAQAQINNRGAQCTKARANYWGDPMNMFVCGPAVQKH